MIVVFGNCYFRFSRVVINGSRNSGIRDAEIAILNSTGTSLTVRRCKGGMKKSPFSTNVALYLGNDTRYDHSYYGIRIGNFTKAFELYHFQRLWVTSNPDFKVTPLFDAEYLRNGRRHTHNYNGILIRRVTHALLKFVISNDLEWPRVA